MTFPRIENPNPAISEAELLGFEKRHSIKLPDEYWRFLLTTNGGEPIPADFPITGWDENDYDGVQAFFGIGANIKTEDLDWVLSDLRGIVPSELIPVACTGGNDYVTLWRGGQVMFWDRRPFWGTDRWSEEQLHLCAPSFRAFLASFYDSTKERRP